MDGHEDGQTRSSHRQLWSSPSITSTELRQFTMLHMPAYFSPGFWNQLILRLCKDNTGVRYVCEALAAAISNAYHVNGVSGSLLPSKSCPQGETMQEFAKNRSIQTMEQLKSTREKWLKDDNIEATLLSCLLLAYTSKLLGDHADAARHAQAGLEIHLAFEKLGQFKSPSIELNSGGRITMAYIIWRISYELRETYLAVSGALSTGIYLSLVSSPKPWIIRMVREPETAENTTSGVLQLQSRLEIGVHIIQSLVEDVWRALQMLKMSTDLQMLDTLVEKRNLMTDCLPQFNLQYQQLLNLTKHQKHGRDILLLQLQYTTLLVRYNDILRNLHERQTSTLFEDILRISQQLLRDIPPQPDQNIQTRESHLLTPTTPSAKPTKVPNFTIADGIVPALFYTIRQCPSETIKQQALSLLNEANTTEGRYDSVGAARVAQACLEADAYGVGYAKGLSYHELEVALGYVPASGNYTIPATPAAAPPAPAPAAASVARHQQPGPVERGGGEPKPSTAGWALHTAFNVL